MLNKVGNSQKDISEFQVGIELSMPRLSETRSWAGPRTGPLFLTVKGSSFMCSINNIFLWLQALVVITVSSDHKKQNSPLPAAVPGCLVARLVFGSNPHSHGAADLFGLTDAGFLCASKGWNAGLLKDRKRKRKQVHISIYIWSEHLMRFKSTCFGTHR